MYNLSERQGALTPSDVSGFGQPEYFVQMGFIQAIKTCSDGEKSVSKQAQTNITLGKTFLKFSVSNLCTVISILISLILCPDCYLLELNCQIMFK